MTPPTMASGTTITKANAASLNEWKSASSDQVAHRDAVGEGLAEVALEEARDPVPVLRQERSVGAELLVKRVDGCLIREGAKDPACDVPRKDLCPDEDDHAEEEERDDCEAEPLEEEPSDRCSYALGLAEPVCSASAFGVPLRR